MACRYIHIFTFIFKCFCDSLTGGGKRKGLAATRAQAVSTGMRTKAEDGEGSFSSDNSSTSTSSSSSGEEEAEEEEEEEEEEDEETTESWTEWIQRVTTLAVDAARKAGVVDWVEEQRRREWRWAGHVSRRDDGRWSRRLLDWEPLGGRRSWGRPLIRWEDALCHFARTKGETWNKVGRDKLEWASWEDEFAAAR